MTEADWLSCADPRAMLSFLRDSGRATDRKLRLFAVGCCRRIWHLVRHEDALRCLEVAERFAEGTATDEELRTAEELAMWAGDDASWHSMQQAAAAWAVAAVAHRDARVAAQAAVDEVQRVRADDDMQRDQECLLLRD